MTESSEKPLRQQNDCETKFSEEDPCKIQASSSSRMFSFYDSSLQSPERRMFPERGEERGSPRKTLYEDHSSSPDNCQTSQVSSSVGESLLYNRERDRQSNKSDSQDNNWDINDPDIPARIDQYVRIVFSIFLYYATM